MKQKLRWNSNFYTVLFTGILALSAKHAEAKLVQILHTNDTHAYLDGSTHDKTRGGAARLKSLMDYYKEKGLSEGVETIALDGGDFTEGNAYYMADRARKSFELHDSMGYDAGVLGNHDYLMGTTELDKIMNELDFSYSLLLANVEINGNKYRNISEKLKPYHEMEVAGLKFGIIGLTTNEIFYTWRFDGGKITSPQKSLLKYEEILKRRKNDVIIALTHIGYKNDMKIAKKSKYLDVIVGGHSHTALFKPIMVESKSKKQIPIVQAGKHTDFLGRLVLDVEKGKPVKVVSYELIPTKYEAQDYKVKAKVEEAEQDLNNLYGKKWLDEVVGYSDLKEGDEAGSRKWAYFITDLLKEHTGADIAIHTPPMNGEEFPIGNITRRGIINSIPRVFDIDDKMGWSMYTTKIRGAWLRLVFEALALFGQPLTFSGIEVHYQTLPMGIKVKTLTINGKKINPLKLYTVGFTEGIVRGAEGVSPYTLALLKYPKKIDTKIWQAIEEKLKRNPISFKKISESGHQTLEPLVDLPPEAFKPK
jgi:2',3'-cyclic-nucleotide 2'-phosphodiesterase (5'-nucleotidase family)